LQDIKFYEKEDFYWQMIDEGMFDTHQEYQEFLTRRGQSIILNGKQVKAYDIRTITLEQFRMLIACGHDTHNNQIRVTKSGMVYLSEDIVGAEQLDDVALCFETFSAHNGYVGVRAAEDDRYVMLLYYALKGNWTEGCSHIYIDSF
jgi:hypothetical protein